MYCTPKVRVNKLTFGVFFMKKISGEWKYVPTSKIGFSLVG